MDEVIESLIISLDDGNNTYDIGRNLFIIFFNVSKDIFQVLYSMKHFLSAPLPTFTITLWLCTIVYFIEICKVTVLKTL